MNIYMVAWACYIIQTKSKNVYLFDTGRSGHGRHLIATMLQHLGVTRLKGIFLSHYNWDHTQGASEIIPFLNGKIDRFYSSGVRSSEREPDIVPQDELYAHLAGYEIPHTYVNLNSTFDDDDITIECLGPHPDDVVPGTYTDTPGRKDGVVMRFSYGDFSILLPGDRIGDLPALSQYNDLHATVFAVPHHGDPAAAADHIIDPIDPELVLLEYNHTIGGNPQAVIDYYTNKGISVFDFRENVTTAENKKRLKIVSQLDGTYELEYLDENIFKNAVKGSAI